MRNKLILLILLAFFGSFSYSQSFEFGIGYQFYKTSGNSIVNDGTETMPFYRNRSLGDAFPMGCINIGYWLPFKDFQSSKSSIGFIHRANLGYTSGKKANSLQYRGTYFYTVNTQMYIGYKKGTGAITSQQFGRNKTNKMGFGFGIGGQFQYGTTDFYNDKLSFSYIRPSAMAEINFFIKDLGLLRLAFYKTLMKYTTQSNSTLGKIPGISYSDYGFTLTKVF